MRESWIFIVVLLAGCRGAGTVDFDDYQCHYLNKRGVNTATLCKRPPSVSKTADAAAEAPSTGGSVSPPLPVNGGGGPPAGGGTPPSGGGGNPPGGGGTPPSGGGNPPDGGGGGGQDGGDKPGPPDSGDKGDQDSGNKGGQDGGKSGKGG